MRFVPILASVVGCLAAAICIDLTAAFQRWQDGDTLIPVLASLYAWTPFYWSQDRVGLLLPYLATPFKHPLTNLLVQNGLSIFGCLMSLVVFAWYVLRDRTAAAVGLAGAALFLLASPAHDRFLTLNWAYPYLIPCALALLAVPLATPHSASAATVGRMARACEVSGLVKMAAVGVLRLALAAALTAVAYWTNVGASVTVAPILVGRFVMAGRERSKAELVTGLLLTGAGTRLGQFFMKWSGQAGTTFRLADAEMWSESWRKFAAKTWQQYETYLIVLGVLVALALVWVAARRTRPHVARAVLFLAVAVATLGTQFGVVGVTQWIRLNGFDLRYLYGTLAFLAVGVAGAVVVPFLATLAPGRLRAATVAFSLLLPFSAVCEYGTPSVASARAGLGESTGYWTADLIDTDCTHLIGDYWCVWPAMFHTNMTRADRGEDRKVWAVTMRAEVTHPQWGQSATEQPRIGALIPNPALPHYTGPTPDRIGLPGMATDIFPTIKRVEIRSTLWLYVRDDPPKPVRN